MTSEEKAICSRIVNSPVGKDLLDMLLARYWGYCAQLSEAPDDRLTHVLQGKAQEAKEFRNYLERGAKDNARISQDTTHS